MLKYEDFEKFIDELKPEIIEEIIERYSTKVYIAGSITNNPDYLSQFEEAEANLKKKGYRVINPVCKEEHTYKEYIDLGLSKLQQCTHIYLLKGYETSKGALLEKTYAETVGMTVWEE